MNDDHLEDLLSQMKAQIQAPPRKSDLNPLDVLDCEKRLTRILNTPEGRQAARNITGFNFVFQGEIDKSEEKLPIVAVLQPAYDRPKRGVPAAFDALFRYSRKHCHIHVPPSGGSSVVHWGRNTMWADLIRSGQPWDFVLWWDDDIIPQEDALVRMLSHKVDIIAGGCTLRKDPPMPNFRVWDPAIRNYKTAFDYGEGLVQVGAVGTGFMLVSNAASLRIAEYYLNCEYERKYYGLSGELLDRIQNGRQQMTKENQNCWWFENLKQPDGHGEYGEDISFCFKAMECGIPVYVDTSIRPQHIGEYGFSLKDYEGYRDGILKDQLSIGERITSELANLIEVQ